MPLVFSGLNTKGSFNLVYTPPPPPPATRYLWTWGSNSYGKLGDGTTIGKSSPIQIGALTNWSSGAAGWDHSLAVKTDGTLWGWGRNYYGAVGDGSTIDKSSPVQVGSLTTWSKVKIGAYHSFALKTDGTIWSWGNGANTSGALGLGSTTNRSSPVQIGALTTWASISTSWYHSGAIKTDGTLWTWGDNTSDGRLGLGNTTNYSSPKQVGALTNWLVLSTGYYHTTAIKTDGTLWTWGRNSYGRLGLGNTTYYSSPKQIGALTTWSSVSSGGYHTFGIKTDGTLWAWGRATGYGSLGLGDTINRSSPVQVGALTTWSTIDSRLFYNSAIKTDGTLWGWGQNSSGQIGLNNKTVYSSPKQVGALTNWLATSAGMYHTIAIAS